MILAFAIAFMANGQEIRKTGQFIQETSPFEVTKKLESTGKFIFGRIKVPERAEVPEGKTVDLAIGIFKSRNAPSKDPLVLCAGGPGLSYLDDFVPGFAGELGDLFLEDRDVVIVESRGLKYSDPFLIIPDIKALQLSLLDKNISADETIVLYLDVLKKAYDRFTVQGIDLSAVNSKEIANEIAYVMTRLGYDTFAMFGSSYGSEIVQNMLMYHPERVSSAVLNGVVDIYRSGYDMHSGMVEALEEAFSAVDNSPVLTAAYPDLKERFLNKVSELNVRPDTLNLMYGPTGEEYKVLLNGNRIALWLFYQMYFNTQLPTSLDRISRGDYTEIISNPGLIFPIPEFSTGLSLSVFLSGTYDVKPEHLMEGTEYEELIKGASLSTFGPYFYKEAIKVWPVQQRSSPQKFYSKAPLLLLSGKFDHLCKPSYATQLAEEQGNATLFLFDDVVHSPVDKGPCAIMMMKEFFDDPSKVPDNSCMQAFSHEYQVP